MYESPEPIKQTANDQTIMLKNSYKKNIVSPVCDLDAQSQQNELTSHIISRRESPNTAGAAKEISV